MKARRTHYLISTHQIPGVYNSPFYPPNPSAKEIELRNARPLSHRTRQRLRAQLPSDAAEILNHARNIRTLSRESKSAPLPPISMKSGQKVQVCENYFDHHIIWCWFYNTQLETALKLNNDWYIHVVCVAPVCNNLCAACLVICLRKCFKYCKLFETPQQLDSMAIIN